MPLLELRQLPPGVRCSWEGFHGTWATWMTHQLNTRRLPARYRAEPLTQAGASVEADVSIFEEEAADLEDPGNGNGGGVATAVWAPPQPPLVAAVEFGNLDIFEVRVYDEENARTLVAVVELISPSNKDRPAHREAFATKCAAYLQQRVSVIVVDLISERRANLHEQVAQRLNLPEAVANAVTSDLYAVAYRTAGAGKRMRLEAWPAALVIGATLPTLPLWLAPALVVPLDLEGTYVAACNSLRIPTQGA
jgi:hypothetical protein